MASGATNRPRPPSQGKALAVRANDLPPAPVARSEGYLVARTTPDKLVRHDISDEQLTMLTSGGERTIQREIMWVALGTAAGAVVPALSSISALGRMPSSFGYWELAECGIFFAAVVVFGIMAFVVKKEPDGAAQLAQAIRERTAKELNSTDGH